MFPIEIWEIIFSYCEARDLMRLRSVCKLWNTTIPNHLKDNNKWYKQCMKDVPSSDLKVLLNKTFPYSDGVNLKKYSNHYKHWKSVYISWNKWKDINSNTVYTIEKMYGLSVYSFETITCIHTSGCLVAIGTSDGYVKFYNMYDKKRAPLFVGDHASSISDVKIIEYENHIIGVSVSCNKNVKFWDILQEILVCQDFAEMISVSHGNCYLLNENILKRKGLYKSDTFKLTIENPKFKAMSADKNEIYLWSSKGTNYKLQLEDDEFTFQVYDLPPPKNKYGQYKALSNGIGIYISYTDGVLSISVNFTDWTSYDIFSFLQAKPTSVYYYNSTLIIGLDNGDIYCYRVENICKLMQMDFSPKKASLKIEICDSPIIFLETLQLNSEQIIIATCEKYIYIVNLSI